jgi:hypothetical protein
MKPICFMIMPNGKEGGAVRGGCLRSTLLSAEGAARWMLATTISDLGSTVLLVQDPVLILRAA